MRNTISRQQVLAAYKISKRIYEGTTKKPQGVEDMVSVHGLNETSAIFFVNNLKSLLLGEIFKRKMSAMALEYFIGKINNDYGFQGLESSLRALKLHIDYWEDCYKKKATPGRKVLEKYLTGSHDNLSRDQYFKISDLSVEYSRGLDRESRLNRIKINGNATPSKKTVTSTVFSRNPDVVAETLVRAEGRCEKCGNQAPFVRAKDRTPYLEVHHRKRLADGGEDSLENTIAVCPNCHRELHFG